MPLGETLPSHWEHLSPFLVHLFETEKMLLNLDMIVQYVQRCENIHAFFPIFRLKYLDLAPVSTW